MADEDENQRAAEAATAVVVVKPGEAASPWTELKDDQRSLKPRGSTVPCTSTIEDLETTEKCGKSLDEPQESSSFEKEEEYIDSATSPGRPIESSEELQKIEILENVSIAADPVDDSVNVTKKSSSNPILDIEPSSSTHSSAKDKIESIISTESCAKQRVESKISTDSGAKERVESKIQIDSSAKERLGSKISTSSGAILRVESKTLTSSSAIERLESNISTDSSSHFTLNSLANRDIVESKKSEDGSHKDVITELRTPNPVKMHSEWVSGDSTWSRKDYLLKQTHRSEVCVHVRDKELERQAPVGPSAGRGRGCRRAMERPSGIHISVPKQVGSSEVVISARYKELELKASRHARERPSGISICMPQKSSKNVSAVTGRPTKTIAINLTKKSTADMSRPHLGSQSKQNKETARAATFITHTQTPKECAAVLTTHASDNTKEWDSVEEGQCSKQDKKLFKGVCEKMNFMCMKLKTLF